MVAYFESRLDNPLHVRHLRYRRDVLGIAEEDEGWQDFYDETVEEEVRGRFKVTTYCRFLSYNVNFCLSSQKST